MDTFGRILIMLNYVFVIGYLCWLCYIIGRDEKSHNTWRGHHARRTKKIMPQHAQNRSSRLVQNNNGAPVAPNGIALCSILVNQTPRLQSQAPFSARPELQGFTTQAPFNIT